MVFGGTSEVAIGDLTGAGGNAGMDDKLKSLKNCKDNLNKWDQNDFGQKNFGQSEGSASLHSLSSL